MSSTLVRTFRFSTQQGFEDRRQGKQPEGLMRTRTSSFTTPESEDAHPATGKHYATTLPFYKNSCYVTAW